MRSIPFFLAWAIHLSAAGCGQRDPDPAQEPGAIPAQAEPGGGPKPKDLLGDKQTAERKKRRLQYAADEEMSIPLLKKLPRDELDNASALAVLATKKPSYISVSDLRGHHLATHHNDGWIRVWDLNTRQATQEIRSEKGLVLFRSYSPDRDSIAWVPPLGKTPYVCDLKTKKNRPIPGQWLAVQGVAFSVDGKTIAISGLVDDANSVFELRDTNSGDLIKSFPAPAGLSHIQFSPNGSVLAGIWGSSIVLWETKNWQEIGRLKTGDVAHEFAFSPNGWSICLRDDSVTQVWDLTSMTKKYDLPGIEGFGNGISFDPSERYVAYSTIQELAIWDRIAKKLVVRVNSDAVPDLPSGRIQFSSGGRFLLSMSSKIFVWDFQELLKKYAIGN